MIEFENLNKYQVINGITDRDFGSIDISNPKSVSKFVDFISKSFGKKINSQNIIFAQQVHSSKIHICSKKDKPKIIPDVDALITCEPGLILVIRTADCIPVLLFDPRGKVVAAVHAGRRGLLENIITKTIDILKNKFHCLPRDILVGIGPYIKNCCYDVNSDIEHEVKKVYLGDWGKNFQKRNSKLYLDLGKMTYHQLTSSGICKGNIEDINLCTSCRNDLFFSHRKSKTAEEKSQRFATFIGI